MTARWEGGGLIPVAYVQLELTYEISSFAKITMANFFKNKKKINS